MAGGVAGQVAQRGVAIINLLSPITPSWTFYIARDWEKVLAAIDSALPLTMPTIPSESSPANRMPPRGLRAWPGAGLPLPSVRSTPSGFAAAC